MHYVQEFELHWRGLCRKDMFTHFNSRKAIAEVIINSRTTIAGTIFGLLLILTTLGVLGTEVLFVQTAF